MEATVVVDKNDPEYYPYQEYVLSKEELRSNKYPNEQYSICSGYSNTKDWPKISGKKQCMKVLSIDCEMVETTMGLELAFISVINFDYETVYESIVKPGNPVINYLTW
jgi:RNA exonuclease 1